MDFSPSFHEPPPSSSEDALELNEDLERIREDAENMSVRLTWMALDMLVLRTSPDLVDSLKRLEEAYQRCRAAVSGHRDREPQTVTSPDPN